MGNEDVREKAYKYYQSGMKYREIAEKCGVSLSAVKSWAARYWKKGGCGQAEKKSQPTRKKVATGGAPKGNQNAIGNRGGAAPAGNKNAVTTGEFEALLFDCLNDEEKRLVEAVPVDKQRLLLQEIQLLTVRERRMLKRIEAIKESVESLFSGETIEGMTLVGRKYGMEKGKETDLKEYRGKLGQIQDIEEALTRVQARKQRAIESLHKFGFDDSQLQIESKKLEIAVRATGIIEGEDLPDDGFLDALKATASEEWENGTDEIDGEYGDGEDEETTSF